ncbi:hypothetical protein V8C44DRAFT_319269 [Trichoderma aethiopicum]
MMTRTRGTILGLGWGKSDSHLQGQISVKPAGEWWDTMHAKHSDSIRFRQPTYLLLPCGSPSSRKPPYTDSVCRQCFPQSSLALLLDQARSIRSSWSSAHVYAHINVCGNIYSAGRQSVLGFSCSAIPSSRITEAEYRPGTSGNWGRREVRSRSTSRRRRLQKLARYTNDDTSADTEQKAVASVVSIMHQASSATAHKRML